ncbi:MAG: tyrosine-protein phosphatase [Caulobacterales bacterium]|nr:tyrosine-protein phosphatase [Caulobacterales bacterium]MCA0373816.1 tyrosine-protein phosphatase [Pseudomonadota bacterium]
MKRFIEIDGVHNFRDFGGYKTKNGKQVKLNHLFRSGQFNGITDEGRARLETFGPKIVVDLRKDNERLKQPSNFGDLKIKKIENNMFAAREPKIPAHLQFLRDNECTPKSIENYMINMSRELAFLEDHKIMFKNAFDALSENNIPLIVHCTAGKDRTGTLCALVLKTLDVHDDDIMDDYLLTNKIPNIDQIIEDYLKKIRPIIEKDISKEALYPLGAVRESYLAAIMDEIKVRHNGVENYLEHIGITKKQIEKMRHYLLD